MGLVKREKGSVRLILTNTKEKHFKLRNTSVDLFIAGGYTREGSSGIVGESAIDYIRQFNLDLRLLSAHGFDEDGFYEPSMQQALVKKQMIEKSQLSLMLCDSSKVHQNYKFHLTSYDQIDYLLTDKEPPRPILDAAMRSNCEIILY